MGFSEMIDRSTLAGRFALLAVATFVALAPLCSTVAAAPAGSDMAALHGDHVMSSAHHDAPVTMFANVAISGNHHGDHCTEHSCCSAALVKTTRLKQADGTAVLAVVAQTSTKSQNSHRLVHVAGPASTPAAAVTPAPLRL
jgi:hypothetical protein